MRKKWVEIRNGDGCFFIGKNGTGSVVETQDHGNYFVPAKIGMRIKGFKQPIRKYESFIMTNSEVQKVDKCDRIVKVFLTRILDGKEFAISERQFQQYFVKSNKTSFGSIGEF